MIEKLLITRIGDQDLLSTIIYGFEEREIEIKPYGKLWTKEYLEELCTKYEKNMSAKPKDKEDSEPFETEKLMLGYYLLSEEEILNDAITSFEDIKVSQISPVLTYVSVQDIRQVKSKGTYRLNLKGISRHKLVDAYDDINNVVDDIALATLVKTNKFGYKLPTENYPDVMNGIAVIENTITNLTSSQNIWRKIKEHETKNNLYSYHGQIIVDQDIMETKDTEIDTIKLISTLMVFSFVDNRIKLEVIESEDVLTQINLVIWNLKHFATSIEWSPVEQKVFSELEIFAQDEIEAQPKKPRSQRRKSNEKDSNEPVSEALIEKEINKRVKDNLEKQQREYLLKEKLKAIKESLQDNDSDDSEDESEYSKILKDETKSKMYPDSVIKLIKSESNKLKSMMSGTPDANITNTFISTLKSLPWRKTEIESLDINKAREILDKNHYGLGEVKERIIEYLSLIINHKNQARKKNADVLLKFDDNHEIDLELFKEENNSAKIQKNFNNVPILTLVGPPGTGKTSLARAIAEALNKSYIKISLGGVHDESEIRGHRRTYVGAMPGKIIKAIQKSGVSNPLILLDEIDKMSKDFKGDPSSAMLEVLDPEQNTKFQDNYIEHEYDLSKVLFIATANYYENIPAPLLDRVEIIELSSYTTNEKVKIAREHLIDITTRQSGLDKKFFDIDDDVIEMIVKNYTAEAGVRGLKRQFDKIARKIVTKIVAGEKIKNVKLDKETVIKLLGTPRFSDVDKVAEPQIGVINGLAYTSIGGSTLQIEVSHYPSQKGGFKLTGSLKDVMKESASIAYSYVRSNAKKFNIDFDFENNEVHIHVPEGAVPKDGPSAGITFTTALISALSSRAIPQDVAMTGEITLRGRVLEIGGLKEKSFAAFKKGIKTVFIPKSNEKNLKDIPSEVKDAITFIPVDKYEQVYEKLFK
ncbi:endopeptidase La [Mycoplasmopsis mucosicanis]|uniref:endopeptidase La n=1 Tax=Mycoplasmopsis mucosicanis TaxID=458208 RepID=A0A507SI86_9BACT|nr:endopeptidase La [Mycoplasmopsis mucosicanis]TQC51437.1 endopeptidase La [Mycoplasmopsis mucosicanis]